MSDFIYAKVREEMLNALNTDLIGPSEVEEMLDESPLSTYITGMLYPLKSQLPSDFELENNDFISDTITDESETADEEYEDKVVAKFKQQSSIGLSFYVIEELAKFEVKAKWGEYCKDKVEQEEDVESGKKKSKKTVYIREQKTESIVVDLKGFDKTHDIPLVTDALVKIRVIQFKLKNNIKLVSVYLYNGKQSSQDRDFENVMFQAEISVKATDESDIFLPEHKCREKEISDEFYYEKRPIYSRGHGCAVSWQRADSDKAYEITTEFIPTHEINGVSPELESFGEKYFSMRFMSRPSNKVETIAKLRALSDEYAHWIGDLNKNDKMQDSTFAKKGEPIIDECQKAYNRITQGIDLLEINDDVFKAFCFMNQAMYLQRSISQFASKHGKGIDCSLGDFSKEDHSTWRPFQIAFILLNIASSANPLDTYRDNVDLLYFPTGGGKTEAYLGLIAFVIGYRRLTASSETEYEKDGGVTVFLRYTLRLLTTQQRDRLTKMICAAEIIRSKNPEIYGKERISIGFWVGGGVTPNNFKELDDTEKGPQAINKLTKQIIVCPMCGTAIKKDNYDIDTDKCEVKIHCPDSKCLFYKFNSVTIPVYLIDEEIYRKCPTVIISTVDKFARLPWDEKMGLLFGKSDRYCERHGYIAVGEDHKGKHNKKKVLPATQTVGAKSFYPPELIVQDELHLITGPLGTIYGAYETVIEDLCSVYKNGKKILPKYIVSTATIKNADAQIRCLYGRDNFSQFPPSGFDISDSYFIKEIPLEVKPFRKYCGICATGKSMKTTILRVYSVLLQQALELSKIDAYKDYVDPYHTLIGYFNSIRELGGTVRLLQDDIPARIKRIVKKYGYGSTRYLNRTKEITSRVSSYQIAELLEKLTLDLNDKECLDVAIATNMIAVGMDVDRLGLMSVMGQPKQNSEYIQATSRIGRKYPGLVVTIYNPYRPRDLSHYENFKGFHSHMYRYVEGTTATPFSARARDRVLHALLVSLLRLKNGELAINEGASRIDDTADTVLQEAKKIILQRVAVVASKANDDTLREMDIFIDEWKHLSNGDKKLYYYVKNTEKFNRLLNYYNEFCTPKEKPTLNSMREVESTSALYYYTEGAQ
ncbi:helicase-like protein [Desulfitobacterium sp. LBE]|uniref:DISARM system helicase DrmA n=1 Tax=Desulfitobacterium sp. LBE TaxID=884086 RepID=UPI00119C8E87|nr:DISARM system helicase DrmA [Desulfitobacterium sp. LBE]TWH59342.1 helicase-like protein [Desulfitobacterium sp. LBE]